MTARGESMNSKHQQKTIPSGRTGCIRVDALGQSRQRHLSGRIIRDRRQYHALSAISPSDRRFAVSSRSIGLLFYTTTLALWPNVTIHRNGFIVYTLASGLPRIRIHGIARIHEISPRASETKSWET
jgi:hypothetical protein